MNWDNYRLVLEFKRAGSIRAAGQQMGVDHSTISRRLSKLRESLNDQIFDKRPDGLILTEAGLALYNAAKEMEATAFAADRARAQSSQGQYQIRLSIPPPIGFLITDEIKNFVSNNPDILLTLDFNISLVDLDRSEADIVIRGMDAPPGHLVGRRLFPYYLCFYGQRDYLKTTKPEDYRWISREYEGERPKWMLDSPYPEAPIAIQTDDIMTRHNLAVSGFGLTCGACYLSDPHPALDRLDGAKPFRGQDLWVLTHPDLRKVPDIKKTLKFLGEVMKKHRDLIEGKVF